MNSFHSNAAKEPESDGFIVIAMLWLLAALATLVSIYSVYVINTAAAFRSYEEHLQAGSLVSAATELAAYQLTSKAQHHPTHGQFVFRMAQATVSVEFRSEAARIDLNVAPKELLASLFASLGAQVDDAQTYAARVIAWRTKPTAGQNLESAAYQSAGLGYVPRGAPFAHPDELSLILGLPPALVERALPLVTVYGGVGKVNVIEAAPEVIAALPGFQGDHLRAFLAHRQANPEDAMGLSRELGAAQAYGSADPGKATRVTVATTFADGLRTLSEVVILPFEKGSEPYAILSWADRLDNGAHAGAPRMASQ